eukprot:GHVL01002030.1.p1 GENE.GHVL01002030.1~~GHVL01002030.1.p1  ORF type:complete len:136 (+),score=0.84 GHVL01002030.1:177-584(+)
MCNLFIPPFFSYSKKRGFFLRKFDRILFTQPVNLRRRSIMRGCIVPCKSFHSVNTSCQFSYFGLKSSTQICCYSAVAAKADIVCSVYVLVSLRIMFFRQMGLADELLHPCSNVKNCMKFSFLGKIVYEAALCCLN